MRRDSWHKMLRKQRPVRGVPPPHHRLALAPEPLESRLLLTVPAVMSINRHIPAVAETGAASVVFRATFNQAVTGVSPSDFRVTTQGSVSVQNPIVSVSGSGLFYTVTVSGIQGHGEVRLDLVDQDTIQNTGGTPIGGVGLYNGSFQGQSYSINQVAPYVVSIARAEPDPLPLGDTSADFTVTFSEAVTGVDSADFVPVFGGGVSAGSPPAVMGGGAVYTVSISGITGSGTLGLNLVDDHTIRDVQGNRLATPNVSPPLGPQSVVPGGPVPISVSAGDLNADSIPDLVVANFFGANVGVFLGNGNGTFQSQTTYATGVDPNAAVAADVNGDGQRDLVVANFNDANVSVLLGNGDGTFQSQVTYATLVNPAALVVQDINSDGRPDLVVANRGSDSLSVLLGNGDGTFQTQTPYATGVRPQSVAVADFNLDGKLDLVVANSGSNNVGVLLASGTSFLSQTTYATGTNPQSVVAADVNSDGLRDLVVANFGSHTVGVLLGNGDGTFQSQVAWAVGMQPQAVLATDMNADGKRDLVVANSMDDNLGVLLGGGDATFQAQSTSATGDTPYALVAFDADADGRSDLIAANLFGGSLSVLLGQLEGDFTGEVYTIPPAAVVGRTLFYRGSPAFDVTNMQNPGFSHDNAIAPDKWAYLPGSGIALFANVSSYAAGINGIMVDLLGPGTHASINANDFVFKVGNNNSPNSWAAAPAPSAVTVRAGAGTSGADRVEIMWVNGAIQNAWLEVQVLPTANTGLTAPDIFFWGSKLGDTGGEAGTEFTTTASGDVAFITAGGFGPAGGITDVRDMDRDNVITASGDRATAAANIGTITRINIGGGGPFAPQPEAESDGDAAGEMGVASALAHPGDRSGADIGAASRRLDELPFPAPNGPREVPTAYGPAAVDSVARIRALLMLEDDVADALELDDEWLDCLAALHGSLA